MPNHPTSPATQGLIDTHQAIRVYQKIRDHGTKTATEYSLNGLNGSTDFDGYTVFLNDENVTLNVYFHYKYTLNYKYPQALEAFIEKMRLIDTKF
jgi:sRNA-binding regulator protein Hfq